MAHSRKYSVNGSQTVDSSTDSVLGITGTTAVEPSIFFVGMGSETTPADNQLIWRIGRTTAAGTATAVTPQNLGPGTVAATSSAGENHTAEPTYTAGAVLFRLGLNQRAAHSIVFDPEGCLTVPATSNNGLAAYPSHASAAPDVGMVMHFRE